MPCIFVLKFNYCGVLKGEGKLLSNMQRISSEKKTIDYTHLTTIITPH